MYFSAFDFWNNGNNQRPQDGQQQQQQQFPSAFYQQPTNYVADFTANQQSNRPVTPLDATFPTATSQQYFDDLFQPGTEIGSDQFLLPAFTTIYQGASDNQQQNTRLYYDDTPQPQYANLVVPGSTAKQPNKELQQHQSFASGLLSPFPAVTSDLYYDSAQQYPVNAQLLSPAANNNVNLQVANANNNELSLFGTGFFEQPQYFALQSRQEETTSRRQDAAVDTADLTVGNANVKSKKPRNRFLAAGVLPSQDVPLVVAQRPHKCALCGNGFTRAWTLRQHMASHVGVKIFYCPICGKSLARRQNVAYHLKKRHSLPVAAHWALSSGNIKDETALLKETLVQREDGSHRCLMCNQTFKSGTGPILLVGHARRHAANFCCMASESCRKRFRSIDALIAHSNETHFHQSESANQLDCSQCSTSFSDWLSFQNHLVEHARSNIRRINNLTFNDPKKPLSKRQYKCLRCWRAFSTRLALARHSQSDSHSYPCTVPGCGKIFAERRRLDAHTKLAHSIAITDNTSNQQETTKFHCSSCNRSFGASSGLAIHVSRTHGVKVVAAAAPKNKARIPCPFRDSETRPCGSIFDRQSQVDKHVKLYHRKRGHRKKKEQTALNDD